MNTVDQKTNYITAVRQVGTKIIEGFEELKTLRSWWNSEDLGNVLTDADYIGENSGLTHAELTAVIGTTHDALSNVIDTQYHAVNLHRVRL